MSADEPLGYQLGSCTSPVAHPDEVPMRALVVRGPGMVSVEELPAPRWSVGHTLIRPTVVGICGTDLEIIDGRIDPAYVRLPLVIGHEWAGVVVRSDDAPNVPDVGTRVVVEGIVPCGRCPACACGDTNVCETYDEFGFTRAGAASELVLAPTSLVHSLEDRVSDESAALIEPAAVVLRALLRAAPRPGLRVLVVGDGSVGLLAVALVRLWSPAHVTMLGARTEQGALAISAGADRFVTDPHDAGDGYQLVIEAAGVPAAVESALSAAGRGGTVVLLGLAGSDVRVPLAIDNLVNADLQVIASFSYTRAAWRQVVELLNSGRLDLTFLVTHALPLEDWAEAVGTLRNGTGVRGKVVLRVGNA